MNNKILLLIVGALILGGVFVLSRNQGSVTPPAQQEQVMEQEDEAMEQEEALEEGEEAVEEGEDSMTEEGGQISVTDAGFEPQSVTVKAGSKVVWTNNTEATANVSSAMHPTHELYPPLNLGDFEPGATVELVFEEAGEYKYHDHLSPTKFGTVVVE